MPDAASRQIRPASLPYWAATTAHRACTFPAMAPGKRPLTNMSPVIASGADGRPDIALGASGGRRILALDTVDKDAFFDYFLRQLAR